MNVVIQIKGHEAIPVRAIPFITSWQVLTPDKLADVLANDELDIIGGIRDLKAYRLNGDGHPVAIPASWWLNFPCKELAGLSDRIKAEQSSHADGYTNQWRPQSILKLPAGAFVWRDEFEPKYKRRFRLTQPTFKGEYWPLLDYESPMLDADTLATVMEGFATQPAEVSTKELWERIHDQLGTTHKQCEYTQQEEAAWNLRWKKQALLDEYKASPALTPTEIEAKERNIERLTNEIATLDLAAGVLSEHGVPVIESAPAVSTTDALVTPHRRNRKPAWHAVAMPYMKELYKNGTYRSAKAFYKALMNRAGEKGSPFTKERGALFCPEAGTTVSEGTVGTKWAEIRRK